MTTENVVTRWLEDQGHKPPAAPESLADEFPLATLPSPPSSSLSDPVSADAHLHPDRSLADVAGLVHPPTPSMDEHPQASHARRRSTSLVGPSTSSKKKHRRHHSEHIPEEGEDGAGSGDEYSSEKSDSDDLELDDMRSSDGLEDDEETGLTGNDRRRRRRRKRRATLLDQRVVPDVHLSKAEEKLANDSLIRTMLINALLIALWCVLLVTQG
jgi:solute carrier family 35 protein C2